MTIDWLTGNWPIYYLTNSSIEYQASRIDSYED